jgi:hypothetical protein
MRPIKQKSKNFVVRTRLLQPEPLLRLGCSSHEKKGLKLSVWADPRAP